LSRITDPNLTCLLFPLQRFGRGEAAVVVVLKPLKDAIRDHDHIYSVVLGSAIKATGSQMPLYVPNGVVLEECIQRAYERSGLSPSDADYVELHATGILLPSFIPRMS
jgi:acyl transferase domain-containing protein